MSDAGDMAAATMAEPKKEKGAGGRALDWWRYYCDPGREGHDPGVRAQLRRCDSPIDAAAIPAAVALARRVGALREGVDDRRALDALNLARVLAHVRAHDPDKTPMRVAGWKTFAADRRESEAGDDRPLLSEVRFRRLLTTGPDEEQVTAFTRLVDVLGGTANVAALGGDFLDWSHPWRGDGVRKKWAEDYFAARVTKAAMDPDVPTTESPASEDNA